MAGSGRQQGSKEDKGGGTKSRQDGGQQAKGRQNGSVPLSAGEQQKARQLEGQIKEIEAKVAGMSNTELQNIAGKLETVERSMLLEKIDNELHTIKETIVKPGDAASTAAAGSTAAAAAVINE